MLAALVVMTVVCTPGCQTERVVTSDGRPMPEKPRRAPSVPLGATPNRMTLQVVPSPDDTDGNGYPDTMQVMSSLFSHPHPMAMDADGAFVFTLYRQGEAHLPDAIPIGEWRFEGEEVGDARATAMWGTCYRFRLSLRTVGSDRMPPLRADLRGRFEPSAGGSEIRSSDEVRPVQLGRGALSGAE